MKVLPETDRERVNPLGLVVDPAVPVVLGESAAGRCRRRVHLDHDPSADRSQRLVPDDGTRHRFTDMDAHRASVIETLRGLFPLAPAGPAASEALSAGELHPVLIQVRLTVGPRTGTADLLLHDGRGYLPVIVRSHRTTDPGAGAVLTDPARPLTRVVSESRKPRPHSPDALALAHLRRMLADLDRGSPLASGGVIGRGTGQGGAVATDNDGAVILWHDLTAIADDYERRFADRFAVASAALAGGPALAEPTRIGECRRCAWWPVCSAELERRHDVSLISSGSDTDVLLGVGIRTVDELARTSVADLDEIGLTSLTGTSARTRARAWLADAPLVRKQGRVTVPRADLELDVDMESYLDDGAYLWGTFLTGPGVQILGLDPGYRGFVTWEHLPGESEGRAFADFWGYLSRLRSLAAERGMTFAAYCYSKFAEERWLRSTPVRYPQVEGMPALKTIEEFCAGPQWVDMYQEIKDQFVVPGSMKLKALAPLAGFHWRDAEPGGENSMAWYRAAAGYDGPPDPALAERVLQYNEDDVRATLALREWMTHKSATAPTAAELDSREF